MSAAFRVVAVLPGENQGRVVFESDYTFADGRLFLADEEVACARSRGDLEQGIVAHPASLNGRELRARLVMEGVIPTVVVTLDGIELADVAELQPSPSRSAWLHAFIALGGSAAGFAASLLYLERADAVDSVHAFKMAYHMAGWHLLLVLTLFPASVWGRRAGIRSVQVVSAVFFCIHAGIALANIADPVPSDPTEFQIALWNAVSGALFLVCVFYGQRAWRDMDPLRAIEEMGQEGEGAPASQYQQSPGPVEN